MSDERLDSEFTENLKSLRKLLPEIDQLAGYDTDQDLPDDIDHSCCVRCVDSISLWEKTLLEKACSLMDLAEALQVSGHVRERYYEIENEKLPDEGRRTGYLVGQ